MHFSVPCLGTQCENVISCVQFGGWKSVRFDSKTLGNKCDFTGILSIETIEGEEADALLRKLGKSDGEAAEGKKKKKKDKKTTEEPVSEIAEGEANKNKKPKHAESTTKAAESTGKMKTEKTVSKRDQEKEQTAHSTTPTKKRSREAAGRAPLDGQAAER